jgi:hypothetical protein
MKNKTNPMIVLVFSTFALAAALRAGPAPSEADVGDPDSFGSSANYMGVGSGFVTLSPACTPAPSPVPPATPNNDQCFNILPQPTETDFEADDLARIKLPKNSTKDMIYPVLNFFHRYTLQNNTGTPQSGLFFYTAWITIDSAALNDPACTDPTTGSPCGGHLQFEFADNFFRVDHNMNAGDRERNGINYTHAGNLGITKRSLVESGIPQHIADKMFKGEMTIHLSISGTATLVTTARITGNMRLFGD